VNQRQRIPKKESAIATSNDPGDRTMRRPPKQPLVPIGELTLLVRVPSEPAATRAFTTAEAAEAQRYAARHGVDCEPLPLAPTTPDHANVSTPADVETGSAGRVGKSRRENAAVSGLDDNTTQD
jgi:hypothetical protein